jgi:hypothetical protein
VNRRGVFPLNHDARFATVAARSLACSGSREHAMTRRFIRSASPTDRTTSEVEPSSKVILYVPAANPIAT